MRNEMSKRHENEQFIHDIQMFNGKNIYFNEWISQLEKVSSLTGKPKYVFNLAKSSGTPYKMISQTPSNTAWSELRRKLPEIYSLVAIDVHAATDLLRKQCANKLLQDYIAYGTRICHWSLKWDPMTIDNKLMITIFIKNLYNNVNTLLDAIKMAQWNLLKLKKYKGLVSEDGSIHSIHTINQISDKSKSSRHFSQSGNVNQAMPPVTHGQSNPTSPWYLNNQYQNSY